MEMEAVARAPRWTASIGSRRDSQTTRHAIILAGSMSQLQEVTIKMVKPHTHFQCQCHVKHNLTQHIYCLLSCFFPGQATVTLHQGQGHRNERVCLLKAYTIAPANRTGYRNKHDQHTLFQKYHWGPSERRGGAHTDFPELLDAILN